MIRSSPRSAALTVAPDPDDPALSEDGPLLDPVWLIQSGGDYVTDERQLYTFTDAENGSAVTG